MHIEMTEQQMRTRGGLMDELLEKAFDALPRVGDDGGAIVPGFIEEIF